MANVWANSMACHPRATCHIAECCHLVNSLSWFQSHMSHCRVQSPGEINVMIVPHCLLRLSSSRAFGHIGQQLGAILNGQWFATYSTSFHLKSTLYKSCWKVLRHVFLGRPISRLPSTGFQDIATFAARWSGKRSIWPAIRNLRSVTMSDSFLELAQSKISSFVMWSLV